ncbi:MAG TPA: class I SAM-dependent methyltransferase, partial [Polyangiaceae bacterium]|nr:class I SAM-dependent methyltransferase [Polyangiaceae bacterium]
MANKFRKGNAGASSAEQRAALMRALDKRLSFKGEMQFPCVPALADEFATKLLTVWATLGRPTSSAEAERLRSGMRAALSQGFDASPDGTIVVSWEASPGALVDYQAELLPRTLEERFDEWAAGQKGPLFGAHPDAKVVSVAATLGEPSAAPVLDVGAGTGRNALALAAMGHPTDALELVSSFCKAMRDSAAAASLPLQVLEADILSEVPLAARSHYRLAFASEVLTHIGSVDEARTIFEKLADALVPGGLLLFNAFLGKGTYEPDRLARELGHTWFASLFSRSDLAFLVDELPFELISDESAYEFEKANTPPSAWPPTTWFESWSQGSNIFEVPLGKAPVEL